MLICVTQRGLCRGEDFLERLRRLAQARPYAVLLREKDLLPPAYAQLARQAQDICGQAGVRLILRRPTAAEAQRPVWLHLSLPELRAYRREAEPSLTLGASVHSVAEAEEAQALGAAYLVAGHIYATDCKRGLPPRGLSFLRDVCRAVDVPVFAIGGITPDKVPQLWASGARGWCVMSDAMTCAEPAALVRAFAAP